jgi:hypothetical protein
MFTHEESEAASLGFTGYEELLGCSVKNKKYICNSCESIVVVLIITTLA